MVAAMSWPTYVMFIHPKIDPVRRSDAVVVIARRAVAAQGRYRAHEQENRAASAHLEAARRLVIRLGGAEHL